MGGGKVCRGGVRGSVFKAKAARDVFSTCGKVFREAEPCNGIKGNFMPWYIVCLVDCLISQQSSVSIVQCLLEAGMFVCISLGLWLDKKWHHQTPEIRP